MPFLFQHLSLMDEARFSARALGKLLQADDAKPIGPLRHVKCVLASLVGIDEDEEDPIEVREALLIEVMRRTAGNLEKLHCYLSDDDPKRAIALISELASFTAMKKLVLTFQGSRRPKSLSAMRLPPKLENLSVVFFLGGSASGLCAPLQAD